MQILQLIKQVSEEQERIFHGGSATKPGVAKRPGKTVKEGEGEKMGKRERELKERKAYLKNFWYVAGKSPHLCTNCTAAKDC